MNSFQTCKNTSDAAPLYLPQKLFLKPIARLNVSIQLPQKKMGKSISHLEVMECLRALIKPEKYCLLKVTKTNLDFIRFEAEIDDKSKLDAIVEKLNSKSVKLKEFPELLRVRAGVAKSNFPLRHDWDTFFRDSRSMNEMKPGERPDTIHISNLPIKWFVPYHLTHEADLKPSEKIFYRVFEKFGQIRHIDIPICDPYRSKMKAEVSGMRTFDFKEEHFFEGYVQFKDYMGFSKAMGVLRDMKLLNKSESEFYTVNIKVDFDKTKHLSDASIKRREIVRERLVRREISREEKERNQIEAEENRLQAERQKEVDKKNAKEQRRQDREEKRKKKILETLKVKGAHEINEKIAREEKKLLKVQRKLEAIRLVEELFKRIKNKKEKDLTVKKNDIRDELTQFKNSSELEVHQQREKLHRIIEGRVVLKSILSGGPRYDDSSSSSDSESTKQKNSKHETKGDVDPKAPLPMPLYGYGFPYPYQIPPMYPDPNYPFQNVYPRGRGRLGGPSTSRGFHNYSRPHRRFRGGYRNRTGLSPDMQMEYYKYFEKFNHEHDNRSNQNSSKSRSRRRSRSRYRTRSREHSRSRSHSKSRSRSNSRRRKRSVNSSKSRSPTRRSRSRRKSSKSPRSKSVDSSKFISPNRLRVARSKSWSLPKESESLQKKRSWSKSPSPKK